MLVCEKPRLLRMRVRYCVTYACVSWTRKDEGTRAPTGPEGMPNKMPMTYSGHSDQSPSARKNCPSESASRLCMLDLDGESRRTLLTITFSSCSLKYPFGLNQVLVCVGDAAAAASVSGLQIRAIDDQRTHHEPAHDANEQGKKAFKEEQPLRELSVRQ